MSRRRKLERAVRVVAGYTWTHEQWAQNSAGVWFRRHFSYASPRMVAGACYSYGNPKTEGQWTRWSWENDRTPPKEFREADVKALVPVGSNWLELV